MNPNRDTDGGFAILLYCLGVGWGVLLTLMIQSLLE